MLPLLKSRFGSQIGDAVQRAASQSSARADGTNRQQPQTDLRFDLEPISAELRHSKERKFRNMIEGVQARRGALLDQGDEIGRVQWSAINIIGHFVSFDNVSRYF